MAAAVAVETTVEETAAVITAAGTQIDPVVAAEEADGAEVEAATEDPVVATEVVGTNRATVTAVTEAGVATKAEVAAAVEVNGNTVVADKATEEVVVDMAEVAKVVVLGITTASIHRIRIGVM